MSHENRMKFFDGLAAANALGHTSFQRLFPAARSTQITSSDDCVVLIDGKKHNVEAGVPLLINQLIAADTSFEVKKIKVNDLYRSLSVNFLFRFDDLGTASVMCSDQTEGAGQMIFRSPLPAPYRYSQPICAAFGINAGTKGVCGYPDCR